MSGNVHSWIPWKSIHHVSLAAMLALVGPAVSRAIATDVTAQRKAVIRADDKSSIVYDIGISKRSNEILASRSEDDSATIWDITTGTAKAALRGHADSPVRVAYSPDGRWIATLPLGGETIRFWDAITFQPVRTGPLSRLEEYGRLDHYPRSFTFLPDGKRLVVAGGNIENSDAHGKLQLWDLAAGTTKHLWKGEGNLSAVVASPKGGIVATGGGGPVVKLWDVETGEVEAKAEWETWHIGGIAFPRSIDHLAFSSEGKILATASSDSELVRLWDVEQKKWTRVLKGHEGEIRCLAASPDGRFLASGSADGTVRLWSIASGETALILGGYESASPSIAFSPDGKYAAIGTENGIIEVWEIAQK